MEKSLKHEEHFPPLHDIVINQYHPCNNVVVYRTVLTEETSDKDITPNIVRNYFDGKKSRLPFSEETIQNMNDGQKQKLANQFGISVNNTYEACIESFKENIQNRKEKGISPELIMAYAEEERGVYVRRFVLTLEAGYISDFKDNHANFYPFEGIELKDFIDPTFPPDRIHYEEF